MLKAHNISFLRLLTVGYISSETYHAVKEYGTIGNFPIENLDTFPEECQYEIKKLFLDEEIALTIALLEEADRDLEENKGVVMQVLNDVVALMNANAFIVQLGKKRFITDYAFCSREMLRESYAVSIHNYTDVVRFVNRFRLAYQARLVSQDDVAFVDSCSANEVNGNQGTEGGTGFVGKDRIVIESNALSEQNKELSYGKYIQFLYSLNKEQFVPYEAFMMSQEFSPRTINCIRNIGIRNFYVNYLFASQVKLLTIRNFGKKSYFELENVKQSLIDYVIRSCQDSQIVKACEIEEKNVQKVKKHTLKEIAGEDKYQLIVAKYDELLQTSSLSVRARNGICSYEGDFIEDFMNSHKDIKHLSKIGRKTAGEIQDFVDGFQSYIDEIIEHDFSEEEKSLLLMKSKYGNFVDEYACDFYSERGSLPMFHIVENILKEELKYKIQFLNYLMPMLKGGIPLTLEQIAEKCNLTRERVRQICTKGIGYMYREIKPKKCDNLYYYKVVSQTEDWAYLTDKFKNEVVIKSSSVEEMLKQENCNLTVSIGLLIMLRIFDGQYCVVGNRPYDMNTRSKSSWNNSFVVKKELVEAFDFDDMRCTLERYFEEHDAEEQICQTAEELLLDFFMSSWNMFESSEVEAVGTVVSEILMREYGLIPDEELHFLIQGHKTLTAADVLFRVLTEKYEPMTVDELYDILQTKYSFKYKSPASIRGIVNSDARLCMVGVDNLVALTEWEHIKLGSVREIIVQFLEKFDEPKPVHDIVGYVLRYRDTTENSIRSTMYSGSQFRQFDNGYFGLADKSYPDEHLYAQSLEFKERVKEMECFLIQKKHFPFASSEDNSEINLRQWWLRNKSSDSLNDVQQNEIKRIQDSYWYLPTDKREVRWFSSFNQYREFVQEHDRRPSCYIEREKSLSEWFAKAQKQFVDGELSENEEKVYLYLCKIL